MNLLFDEDAQKVILEAKQEMHSLKHPYVGSEHLLLAVLKNKDLDITKRLNQFGIIYEDFKNKIISIIGIGSKENEWFLFTPLLKRVLNIATYIAKDHGKCVTPYDLICSIFQEGDGVANRILMSMNVDVESLYDELTDSDVIPFYEEEILVLDELAVNMNEKCFSGKYDPVVGREKELQQLQQILLRKNKNNPLLIGEAGVGKTAIVEELARRMNRGDVPSKLKNKTIYSISMSVLISGTKYRGEFEEKIHQLIQEVLHHPNVILFIDEIHTMVGAGGAEGAIDASNIMKPYLARGDFQVIGATTIQEYSKYIEGDKALARRFQKIVIQEPSKEEVLQILQEIVPFYEKFHSVVVGDDLLYHIVDFSDYYFPGKQPDKTIDFLDELCSYSSLVHNDYEQVQRNYNMKLLELEKNKVESIQNKDFKKAHYYKQRENQIKSKYHNYLFCQKHDFLNKVEIDDLYQIIYHKLKLPVSSVFSSRLKLAKKKKENSVFDPYHLLDKIFHYLEENINERNNKPISMLFVGKSGAGKTFFADKMVELLFDSSIYHKIDLSNDRNCLKQQLFGLNDDGVLSQVKTSSFLIFLVEDLDKTNSSIQDTFYQIVKQGKITTDKGRELDFKNCIFIFTFTSYQKTMGFSQSQHLLSFDVDEFDPYVLDFPSPSEEDVRKYLSFLLTKNPKKILSDSFSQILKKSHYEKYGYKKLDVFIK